MQPSVNKALVAANKNRVSNDTAYFIFDRAAMVPFKVSVTHHRMKHGSMNDPILGTTRATEIGHSRQLISVMGPVIQLVDYFTEGAVLDIGYDTMVEVYDRIDKHLEAHLKAMRTRTNYYIGDTFTVFEDIVEFATAIYPRIKTHRAKSMATHDDPMAAMMSGRANFMTMVSKDIQTTKTAEALTTVCPLQEKLERMKIYYESTHSWRR